MNINYYPNDSFAIVSIQKLTKEEPRNIYILDQEAYQSHIQTSHFKKYKEGTAKIVKSLKLIDVNPLVGMAR